jgi:GntR family transcriptional repressor for pyruvate dehydrogenase complex
MRDVDDSGSARDPRSLSLHDLRPVGVTRLADEVVQQLRRLIVERGLQAGARLPAERDLAATLRASRATVSQALRTLSLMGLVEIRRGSGAYVIRNPASMVSASVSLMADLNHGSVYDLAQVRFWLERAGAIEALRMADEAGIDAIEMALSRLRESVGQASAWIAADTLFHAAVVRAAGNPYLSALYESVHTAVVRTGFDRWVRHDEAPDWLAPENARSQIDLHVPILEGLRRRDEDALCAAVLAHHEALLLHLEQREADSAP